MLKLFYILAAMFLVILYLRDPSDETSQVVVGAAFFTVLLLVLAVQGLSQRIDRAVRQVKEPDFNIKSAELQDWFKIGQVFVGAIAFIVVATGAQGFVRCLDSGEDVTLGCVWDGFLEQVEDDLN